MTTFDIYKRKKEKSCIDSLEWAWSVLKVYSPWVSPASLWAVTMTTYSLSCERCLNKYVSLGMSSFSGIVIHWFWYFGRYWTTKCLIGQPPVCQAPRFKSTEVEFGERNADSCGDIGAANKRIKDMVNDK